MNGIGHLGIKAGIGRKSSISLFDILTFAGYHPDIHAHKHAVSYHS